METRSDPISSRTRGRGFGLLTVTATLIALSNPMPGDADVMEPDEAGRSLGDHLLHSQRLVGDPAGARSTLERIGIDLDLFYQQFISGKGAGGGANPEGVFGHSGSYDFFTRVDFEALAGWRGGQLLLHVKGQYDRNVNDDVGALADPIDDADFDEPIYVDELWLQQSALDDRLRLHLGFVEQQTLFDRNAYANSEDRQFLSTFLDNNGVVPLPNGLAAALIVAPMTWAELAVAVADADNRPRLAGFDTAFDGSDSLSWFIEASFASPFTRYGRSGRYRVGVVLDGRGKLEFDSGQRQRGDVATYVGFDQVLWRSGDARPRELGLFGRFGYADPTVNRTAWFWSVGFEHVGFFPSRRGDVLGLGTYQAIGSAVYRSRVDPGFERETGLELYYAIRALGWLVLTPDLQFIFDPGAKSARGTAFVATLRTRVTF